MGGVSDDPFGTHREGDAGDGFGPSDGRKFGFSVGIAFLIVAGITLWREHPTIATVAGSVGGILVLAGAIVPGKLGPLYRAWMAMARAISKVTTPIFMSVLYFLVLTPAGIIRRHVGSNPLRRPGGDSFWVERDRHGSDLRRQF